MSLFTNIGNKVTRPFPQRCWKTIADGHAGALVGDRNCVEFDVWNTTSGRGFRRRLSQVLVEMHGMILDIAVIDILLGVAK